MAVIIITALILIQFQVRITFYNQMFIIEQRFQRKNIISYRNEVKVSEAKEKLCREEGREEGREEERSDKR